MATLVVLPLLLRLLLFFLGSAPATGIRQDTVVLDLLREAEAKDQALLEQNGTVSELFAQDQVRGATAGATARSRVVDSDVVAGSFAAAASEAKTASGATAGGSVGIDALAGTGSVAIEVQRGDASRSVVNVSASAGIKAHGSANASANASASSSASGASSLLFTAVKTSTLGGGNRSATVVNLAGTCQEVDGLKVGCRSECQCGWTDQCYPKLSVDVDIGVCSHSMNALVAESCVFFFVMVVITVMIRFWLEQRAELMNIAIDCGEAVGSGAKGSTPLPAGAVPPTSFPPPANRGYVRGAESDTEASKVVH